MIEVARSVTLRGQSETQQEQVRKGASEARPRSPGHLTRYIAGARFACPLPDLFFCYSFFYS